MSIAVCRATGRRRSVSSEEAGREYRTPKSCIVAQADSVIELEGSIRSSVMARTEGVARMEARRYDIMMSLHFWFLTADADKDLAGIRAVVRERW